MFLMSDKFIALFAIVTVRVHCFPRNPNHLNINAGVQVFRDCFVHLIHNNVMTTEKANTTYDGYYELAPLDIPVFVTRHDYLIHGSFASFDSLYKKGILHCMDLRTTLLSKWNYRSKHECALPQSVKLQCTVILYIDSPVCSGPASTNVPPGFGITFPCCWDTGGFPINHFFLYLGLYQPEWYTKIFVNWHRRQRYNSNPILVRLYPQGKYLGKWGGLLTCPDYQTYYKIITDNCYNNPIYTNPYQRFECCKSFSWHLYHKRQFYLLNRVTSWKKFISRTDALCNNAGLINWPIAKNLPARESTEHPEYLLQWRNKIDGIHSLFVETFLNVTWIHMAYDADILHSTIDTSYLEVTREKQHFDAFSNDIQDFGIKTEFYFNSVNNHQVRFIMCSFTGKSAGLSLLGYVSAFTFELWVALLTTVFLSVKFLKTLVNKRVCVTERRHGTHNFYTNILRILLTQGADQIKFNKWFYGAWVFGGLFITNSYVGDNIDKLCAPLPKLQKDTFQQILNENFTIHSPPVDATLFEILKRATLVSANAIGMEAALSRSRPEFENSPPESIFGKLYWSKSWNQTVDSGRIQTTWLPPNGISAKFLQPDYYLEIISRCSNDVYIDVSSEVIKLKLRLLQMVQNGSISASTDDIVVSKEKYGDIYHNIFLKNIGISNSKLLRKFHSFVQSGIDQLWLGWQLRVETWNETIRVAQHSDEFLFKPCKLIGNIRVVFYTHLVLSAVSILAFLVENLRCVQSGTRTYKELFRELQQYILLMTRLTQNRVMRINVTGK